MKMALTLVAPSDDTASAATTEESTPPERATTTRSNPTLRTPSAMKPRSRSMTKAASTASVPASESIGLGVIDIVSFVAQQWIGDARATDRAAFQGVEQHRLLRAVQLRDHAADRVDNARA